MHMDRKMMNKYFIVGVLALKKKDILSLGLPLLKERD